MQNQSVLLVQAYSINGRKVQHHEIPCISVLWIKRRSLLVNSEGILYTNNTKLRELEIHYGPKQGSVLWRTTSLWRARNKFPSTMSALIWSFCFRWETHVISISYQNKFPILYRNKFRIKWVPRIWHQSSRDIVLVPEAFQVLAFWANHAEEKEISSPLMRLEPVSYPWMGVPRRCKVHFDPSVGEMLNVTNQSNAISKAIVVCQVARSQRWLPLSTSTWTSPSKFFLLSPNFVF